MSSQQLRHFEIEISELKRHLVAMGDLVGQAVDLAVGGIQAPSADLRDRSRDLESQIDAMETAIEDRCHAILALQSPMVRDLRFLISSLAIAGHLEQVGDRARSISKRAHYIACNNPIENPPELAELGRLAREMLRRAMDAFTTGNGDSTKAVIADEPRSDDLTKACYTWIQERMAAQPARIKEFTHLLRAVGSLEQIGDLAQAIVEETVFIHQAAHVRHHHELLK
jgi:phosphate transport system protein